MKTIPWNQQSAQWDRYKAFHMQLYNGKFALFDTGEFIVDQSHWPARYRGVFDELGFTIFTWRDGTVKLNGRKLYTPDNNIIRRSWVTSDTLLHDHHSNRVVALRWAKVSVDKTNIPSRFKATGLACYFPGPYRPPESLSFIYADVPIELSNEDKTKLRERRMVLKAKDRLGMYDGVYAYGRYFNGESLIDDEKYAALTREDQKRMARSVMIPPYTKQEFPYLELR